MRINVIIFMLELYSIEEKNVLKTPRRRRNMKVNPFKIVF